MTPDELRAAYRRLARRLHPDASGATTAPEMAAVNEAWRVLSDPARRAVYDASLRPAPAAPTAAATDGETEDGETEDGETEDDDRFGDRAWTDDDTPVSAAEARATHRLGLTMMLTVAFVAVALAALFVYAFIRSASPRP